MSRSSWEGCEPMNGIITALRAYAARAATVRLDDPAHKARIEAHAERVARELPPNLNRPQCWACDRVSPSGQRTDTAGWATRPLPGKEDVNETYCGECFRAWGFGDGDVPPPSDPPNVLETWSDRDKRRLRRMLARGMSFTDCAHALGRTRNGIKLMASKLNARCARRPWALDRLAAVFAESPRSAAEIASETGLRVETVRVYRWRMRNRGVVLPDNATGPKPHSRRDITCSLSAAGPGNASSSATTSSSR